MIRPTLCLVMFATILGLLAGCGDGMTRGIVITGDGRVGANTSRNYRINVQEVLRIAIEDDLGTGWRAKVVIDELPEFVSDKMVEGDGEWFWRRITAAVVIIPPPGAALPEAKRSEYQADIAKALVAKLIKKDPALVKLAISTEQPQLSQAQSGLVIVPANVTAAQIAPTQRRYVVQAGDTLADISTAFYGSPQHWRSILAANPALDPASLKPGSEIVIPLLAAPTQPAPVPAAAPSASAPAPQ